MSTEQHEAFRICEEVTEYTGMTVDESNRAKVLLAEMHALIVQMAEALGFVMDRLVDKHETDEAAVAAREAITAATQYLTRGPKT